MDKSQGRLASECLAQTGVRIPPLEKTCANCGGTGKAESGSHSRCEECDGEGYVITADGERILAFLRARLNLHL